MVLFSSSVFSFRRRRLAGLNLGLYGRALFSYNVQMRLRGEQHVLSQLLAISDRGFNNETVFQMCLRVLLRP